MSQQKYSPHHVVIIGGGFGGLYAAKSLGRKPGIRVTLIDKRNFHLFQPLLYQVATGGLSPSEIASPLRQVLRKQDNVQTLMGEAVDIIPDERKVLLRDGEISYDSLIVATGSKHHYFGNEHWADRAPGLKTLEDAIDMRHRVLLAFEAAEREEDEEARKAWLQFVIVGGGPTGVELAGSVAELAQRTLKKNFRRIKPDEAKITIVEGSDRPLPVYSEHLSNSALQALKDLKVEVYPRSLVVDLDGTCVKVKSRDGEESCLYAHTVLWAAGVKASPLGQLIADKTGAELDRIGRVMVNDDLSVPGYPNLFVVGDLANFSHTDNEMPLPGIAPVAIQEGAYVAKVLIARSKDKPYKAFKYFDKGSMAVIGQNKAVARIGGLELSGFPAWFIWIFVHIMFLVEFENRIAVTFNWLINYFLRKRSARLITVKDPFPLTRPPQPEAKALERCTTDNTDPIREAESLIKA